MYIMVWGQSSLSDISNEYSKGMSALPKTGNTSSVVLSLDDLGIRGIRFVTSRYSLRPVEAPWYQHIRLTGDSLMIKTNVSSLDQGFDLANQSKPYLVTEIKSEIRVERLWDCPTYPDISSLQWNNNDMPMTDSRLRMRHVDMDRILSGLTVSYGSWTNMSFHGHDQLARPSKPLPVEVEWIYANTLVWIYFPLSPEEKICGFWTLTRPGGLTTVAVSTFNTLSNTS